MIVLSVNQKFFRTILLMLSDEQKASRFKTNIANVFALAFGISEILLVLPSCAYFLANITNLYKATASMYCIASFSISCGMNCLFIANRKILYELITNHQVLVNESSLIYNSFLMLWLGCPMEKKV